jgi:hypothetical protein
MVRVFGILSITWGLKGEKPGFSEKPGFFPRTIEMIRIRDKGIPLLAKINNVM